MADLEELEDSPQKIVFNFLNTCRCCSKTVLLRNHQVNIFGEKSEKQPEILRVLAFLTGKEIKVDDALPKKLCQACFRKVQNIIEFRSLSMSSLASQELSIEGSQIKRIHTSQQVGESPSSSQQSKKSNHASTHSVRMSLFVDGDEGQDTTLSQFIPIAPKKITPRRLPEFLQATEKPNSKEKEVSSFAVLLCTEEGALQFCHHQYVVVLNVCKKCSVCWDGLL